MRGEERHVFNAERREDISVDVVGEGLACDTLDEDACPVDARLSLTVSAENKKDEGRTYAIIELRAGLEEQYGVDILDTPGEFVYTFWEPEFLDFGVEESIA